MNQSKMVIGQILNRGEENPERDAIRLLSPTGPAKTLTYKDLIGKASRFSNHLKAHGVAAGNVVVIILDPGEELVCAFVGAMLLGAIPTIFSPPSVKVAAEVYWKTLALLLEACGTQFVVAAGSFTAPSGAKVLIAEDFVHAAELKPAAPKEEPSQIAFLQYSSGTTGLRKGVALSNDHVRNHNRHYVAALNLTPADKIVSWLPLYHDMGLIACFVLPLTQGIPVTMMSPFDWLANPRKLFEVVTEEKSTLCWLPNFAYNFMANNVDDTEGLELGSLRGITNCSEPVRHESQQKFFDTFKAVGLKPEALWASYAMAENTFAVTQGGVHEPVKADEVDGDLFLAKHEAQPATADNARKRVYVSSGTPIAGTSVRIVDDANADLPDRRVGEIWIKGDSLFTGYHRRADLTQSAFADGWFRTGDLGYMANGHLFVTGRKKDMIIVAGKNIYPQDIEEIAGGVEGIVPGRTVCFGLYNAEEGTEDLIIVAETKTDAAAHAQLRLQIAKEVKTRTECQASDVLLVPHMWLLKSTSGKISRSANREKYIKQSGDKT